MIETFDAEGKEVGGLALNNTGASLIVEKMKDTLHKLSQHAVDQREYSPPPLPPPSPPPPVGRGSHWISGYYAVRYPSHTVYASITQDYTNDPLRPNVTIAILPPYDVDFIYSPWSGGRSQASRLKPGTARHACFLRIPFHSLLSCGRCSDDPTARALARG